MKEEVIVVVTPQQWINPLSGNAKDYSLEFSVENKVVYVNLPLDINTLLKGGRTPEDKLRLSLLKKFKSGINQINPNLWEVYPATVLLSINIIGYRPFYKFFNKINNYLFARSINRILKQLNLKATIIFNDNLMTKGRYLDKHLNTRLNIYYIRDNFENHRYYKKNNLLDQDELMTESSAVFANSEYLRAKSEKFNQLSFDVGQGLRLPDGHVEGLEVQKYINTPVIGYLGNITSLRLDLKLLDTVVSTFPQYTFLFVGPVDADFAASVLNNYPNVYFTGSCEPHLVGSFIRLFDVAINPQLLNELTIGNYPRKIDEYLMYGKPVVTVRTKAMEMFGKYCYLATDYNEFCEGIRKAFAETDENMPGKRIAFASEHTWEASKQKIYSIVEHLN